MDHKHTWLPDGTCVITRDGNTVGKYKTPNDIATHLAMAMDQIHDLREALIKEAARNSAQSDPS